MLKHTFAEILCSWKLGKTKKDKFKLLLHIFLYKLNNKFNFVKVDTKIEAVNIVFEGHPVQVHYRKFIGDIFILYEIFCHEVYKTTEKIEPSLFVDLGANVGYTSIYFHLKYRCPVIAVEPSPDNIKLLKLNTSFFPCEIIQGAIACEEKILHFNFNDRSYNINSLSNGTFPVKAVALSSLLKGKEEKNIALKIDIEGGEFDLFSKNLEWLDNINYLVMEEHFDFKPPALLLQKFHLVKSDQMKSYIKKSSN